MYVNWISIIWFGRLFVRQSIPIAWLNLSTFQMTTNSTAVGIQSELRSNLATCRQRRASNSTNYLIVLRARNELSVCVCVWMKRSKRKKRKRALKTQFHWYGHRSNGNHDIVQWIELFVCTKQCRKLASVLKLRRRTKLHCTNGCPLSTNQTIGELGGAKFRLAIEYIIVPFESHCLFDLAILVLQFVFCTRWTRKKASIVIEERNFNWK